jgi:hypothetical protein
VPNEKPDSFQCGPFEVARNPDVRSFVEKLNRLREAVDQCRVQPGVGYTVNRSSGGTVLAIKAGAGGSALEERHPFKISVSQKQNSYVFTVADPIFYGPSIRNVAEEIPFQPPSLFVIEAEVNEDLQILNPRLAALPYEVPSLSLAVVADAGVQTKARIVLGAMRNEQSLPGFQLKQYVRFAVISQIASNDGYPAILLSELALNPFRSVI